MQGGDLHWEFVEYRQTAAFIIVKGDAQGRGGEESRIRLFWVAVEEIRVETEQEPGDQQEGGSGLY